jgi:phosphoglycerate dehydrogenase-like enzyme
MTSSRAVDGVAAPATAPWTDVQACIAHCGMAARLEPELAGVHGLRLRVADQVAAETRDADVLIGYHFPPGSLASLPRLRWLHLTGTGTDHLAATGLPPEVLVTTSAAVPVTAVAEYAISGLLLLLKDLPDLVGRRDAAWFRSDARLLSGSTVAVVGAGRIGRAVLTRLAAFGAHPVAVTRDGTSAIPQAQRVVGIASLAREAEGFDHLMACLPGGPQTRGLIGGDVLAALPPPCGDRERRPRRGN